MRTSLTLVAALGFLAGIASAQTPDPVPSRALSILDSRCGQCHGEKVAMSGLRFSSREALLRGGTRGPAVVPGDSAASLLIGAVEHKGKLTMPPGPKLAEEEIRILRTWVDQSAPWPAQGRQKAGAEWWAFKKGAKPEVPESGGARSPIDAFILAKLTAARRGALTACEPRRASEACLLRSAGAAATAEQIRKFENDKRPDAWERTVDSLLASPRYGEKWGRHWLDLVRYGDTSGFEQDPYILEAWRYRD